MSDWFEPELDWADTWHEALYEEPWDPELDWDEPDGWFDFEDEVYEGGD